MMVCGFCTYAEISKLNPQTRYFTENVFFPDFEYGHIWGVDLENEFSRKLVPWIQNVTHRMGLKNI